MRDHPKDSGRATKRVPGAIVGWWILALLFAPLVEGQATPPAREFRLPPGFVIEKVAAAPLVRYPLFACLDDRGRLFVAEGTGTNLPGSELAKRKLGKVTLLEDKDGDGRFDSSTPFADGLVFPQGVLWHDGAVYVASHPCIWRLRDTDGDGRADRREEFVGRFGFNGNGCDIHGPFMGPDGWIYWTDGRHGYRVETREGACLEGKASRIWRCRPDGSRIERICGGGFDNPVELAFTASADLIGTMDQGTGDALLHYVEGGVYPRGDHPSVKEFPSTGPLLGSIAGFSPALPPALCGLLRIRSGRLGPGFQNTLLTTQFNVHRVQRHVLSRDGSTFRCVNKDFLVSTDYDFHPTDVLEDADGSLLIVDMGAWFNFGCPTSKIAKPQVTGSIYRVRRKNAPAVKDPWGRSLKLESLTPARVAKLLGDPRPKVRDRAVERLVKLGADAVPALASASPVDVRRRSLWALSRIGTAEAREAVRKALKDEDPTVRQVAAHCAGIERDAAALAPLRRIVVEDEPPVRLKAAEALGRLGRPEAVAALLESLSRGVRDRFLEHALIFALIRIGNREATLGSLDHPDPRVRRAGLIALDQMTGGGLTRDRVAPLLDSDDPDLQRTALEVISRHEGWVGETLGLVREWLGRSRLSVGQRRSLRGALLAFIGKEEVRGLVANALGRPELPIENRLLLLEVVGRCRLDRLPEAWVGMLRKMLRGGVSRIQREVVAVVRTRGLSGLDAELAELSRRKDLPAELRVAALDCIAPRRRPLAAKSFDLLRDHLGDRADPLVRVTAARALGASSLDKGQLVRLADSVAEAGPLLVPLLAPAFSKTGDAEVGSALLAALRKSKGAEALTADDLRRWIRRYPAKMRASAEPLLRRLGERQKGQEAYLAELIARVDPGQGDPQRGRKVFFSAKAGCAACHRVEGKGGRAGPDLSRIGAIRTTRDLLEAIVFPSSTIVPDYRQYILATRDGRTVAGAIVRESADALYLRTGRLEEIRVARAGVKAMKPSGVSIMPKGLEKTMTPRELGDLLVFLYSRR